MEPVQIAIALGPLAVYLLLMAAINLSRRPFVTSGARDLAALGIGVSGFVAIGPFQLFLPLNASYAFGPLVWLLLLLFYFTTLSLFVLVSRPRLVIYNIGPAQVRALLADLVAQLDKDARWAGECLLLPQAKVQLHVEHHPVTRNVQLISAGPQQSFEGWKELESALAQSLRRLRGDRNPVGYSLLAFGLAMVSIVVYWTISDADAVVRTITQAWQANQDD